MFFSMMFAFFHSFIFSVDPVVFDHMLLLLLVSWINDDDDDRGRKIINNNIHWLVFNYDDIFFAAKYMDHFWDHTTVSSSSSLSSGVPFMYFNFSPILSLTHTISFYCVFEIFIHSWITHFSSDFFSVLFVSIFSQNDRPNILSPIWEYFSFSFLFIDKYNSNKTNYCQLGRD